VISFRDEAFKTDLNVQNFPMASRLMSSLQTGQDSRAGAHLSPLRFSMLDFFALGRSKVGTSIGDESGGIGGGHGSDCRLISSISVGFRGGDWDSVSVSLGSSEAIV